MKNKKNKKKKSGNKEINKYNFPTKHKLILSYKTLLRFNYIKN